MDQAVAALRHGRPQEAEGLLGQVLDQDPPLSLRGPALGLRAQALMQLARLSEAKECLRAAMRIARELDDQVGYQALRGLNTQLYAELAEQAKQTGLSLDAQEQLARPLADVLADAKTPQDACMAVIARASAHASVDNPQALSLSDDAWERAQALPPTCVRERVLARLCQARAHADDPVPYLEAARDLADRNSESTLLAAVVQAARAQGHVFAPKGAGL